MTLVDLAFAAAILAAVPALVYLYNLPYFCRLPKVDLHDNMSVSVLIPARDEENTIRDAVESVLFSKCVEVEVVVLDDHSTDRTAKIVQQIGREDERVRVEKAPPLPLGWCGKQHACHVLSQLARHEILVFMDADVRLEPSALKRSIEFLGHTQADLVSGFPKQVTESLSEKLVVPLIHSILLGFLPLDWMRRWRWSALSAGCGQLFVTRRPAYRKAGGHKAIKTSRHDGITLPRAFRKAGLRTDVFDGTDLATCRMYHGLREMWNGLAKNATEGMASVGALPVFTVFLLGGQILPIFLVAVSLASRQWPVLVCSGLALALSVLPRILSAWRFRQSYLGAMLHPAGVAILLAIQWYAFIRRLAGKPVAWKGRT